jgi:hypothetical protein
MPMTCASYTTGHLDWLEWTFSADLSKEFWLPEKLNLRGLSTKDGRTKHYNSIFTNDYGIIILTNGEKREGTHILLTGEPLENIRNDGLTDRELVQHLTVYQGLISRLDVAVNIHDGTLKAQDLEAAYLSGECVTPARGAEKRQKLLTDEDTLYIGSPSSERRFRAYNKGAQLHTGAAWLRLELQLRKLRARAVGAAMVQYTDTRAVINRAIRDFVEFPSLDEYTGALQEAGVSIAPVPRKPHKTYAWLMNVVAPALAKYAADHPDEDVLDAFWWAVKAQEQRQEHAHPDKP